jgi:hypothetical protein
MLMRLFQFLASWAAGVRHTKTEPYTVSASARKRMSLAQKARWARRSAKGQAGKMKPKRTISTAGRKRIAAAQRAPWAKVRAKKAA